MLFHLFFLLYLSIFFCLMWFSFPLRFFPSPFVTDFKQEKCDFSRNKSLISKLQAENFADEFISKLKIARFLQFVEKKCHQFGPEVFPTQLHDENTQLQSMLSKIYGLSTVKGFEAIFQHMDPRSAKSTSSFQESSRQSKQLNANWKSYKTVPENYLVNKLEPSSTHKNVKDEFNSRITFPSSCANKPRDPFSKVKTSKFIKSFRRSVNLSVSNRTIWRLPTVPQRRKRKKPTTNRFSRFRKPLPGHRLAKKSQKFDHLRSNHQNVKASTSRKVTATEKQRRLGSSKWENDRVRFQFHKMPKNSNDSICRSKRVPFVNPFSKFKKPFTSNKLHSKKNAKGKSPTFKNHISCRIQNEITFTQYLELTSNFVSSLLAKFKSLVLTSMKQTAHIILDLACRSSSSLSRFFIKTHRIIVVTSALIFFYHVTMNYVMV